MGFSNVTGKSRPKRPGCETKSERNKRKARQNDQETVEELRVVKAKRCGAKGGRSFQHLAAVHFLRGPDVIIEFDFHVYPPKKTFDRFGAGCGSGQKLLLFMNRL